MNAIFSNLKSNKGKVISILFLSLVIAGASSLFFNGFSLDLTGKAEAQSKDDGKKDGKTEGTSGASLSGNGNGGDDGGFAQLNGGGNQPPTDLLCGFGWGGTDDGLVPANARQGIGWISVNSKDCDLDANGTISASEAAQMPGCPAGVSSVYNISVDNNRRINGYAWSSNLGWLKFGNGDVVVQNVSGGYTTVSDNIGPLTGMPNFSNYSNQPARVQNSGNQPSDVYGWARFCSATINRDCNSALVSNSWDGWVALSPDDGASATRLQYFPQQNRFQGYSWAGAQRNPTTNEKIGGLGWIKWDPTNERGLRYCFVPELSVGLTADPDHNTDRSDSTLEPTLTATPSPVGATDYKFSCDLGESFTDWRLSTQTNNHIYTGCDYTLPQGSTVPEYFTPQVVARRVINGQTKYATSSVDVRIDPPRGPNDLGATCSVSPKPVFLNQETTWRVQITPVGQAPYDYRFVFNDGQTPAEVTFENETSLEKSVTRSYSSLGSKSVEVFVTDSVSPSPAEGYCEVDNRVIVDPSIIEI